MSSYPNTKAWYCSSARYAAVSAWATGVSKTVGNLVRQTAPSRGNERVFVCITAGTTGGSEPTWTVTRGAKQATDNGVIWQEATGLAALNGDLVNTTNWADMHAIGTGVALGHVCKDAAGTHIFICTTAGTIGSSEPAWNTSALGNTTADNTATWTYIGASFGNWAAAAARLDNMALDTWGGNNGTQSETGSQFYVGDDHAETQAAAITLNANIGGKDQTQPARIVCVNHSGSVPPVSADVTTGATITTTGSNLNYVFQGFLRMYGVTVTSQTGGSQVLDLQGDSRAKSYNTCNFQLGAGTGNGTIAANGSGGTAFTEMINCTLKFSGTGQRFVANGRTIWRDGGGIDASGSVPTQLCNADGRGDLTMRGLDLSFLSGATLFNPQNTLLFSALVEDCKVPASFTFVTLGSLSTINLQRFRMARCDNGGHIRQHRMADTYGSMLSNDSVGRTGGADAAWQLTTSSLGNMLQPSTSFPVAKYNTTTGANVTVTMYGIINAAAVPNNNEFWFEAAYPGDSGSSQSSNKSARIADLLSSTSSAALTADTSAWDAAATARANTHAYSTGDVIKLASNPGRLFFCTSGGTSAGSEPGGYAGAVDGGTVTDSGATFRAGCRFKMAVTLTSPQPQIAGPIRAQAYNGKASTSVFVDPFLDLS